jgi:outer membrane lipoprotein-sorting protein
MRRQRVFMLRILIILAVMVGGCSCAFCAEQSTGDTNYVSAVLDGLRQKTARLQSYQCEVNYLFSQPLLESKTLRTGNLYYIRSGNGSKLRINFDTLTQEDGPKQNYKECYIFDGQWLTHIDYQIKQVQKRQLAEANEQIDAFELAKRNFPLIGFDKSEDLKKEFDVNLASEPNGVNPAQAGIHDLIQLHLTVKPNSHYKEDYKSVEVWIDKQLMLPARISAVSTQDDIYEFSFIKPKVNEAISEKIFEFTVPEGFGKPEIIPLQK